MIRKFLLSTAAIAAGMTTAYAADLPARRAPPVYVPPVVGYSWTGFYVGGQVGYAFGRDNARQISNIGAPDFLYPVGQPNGAIGGAHAGYNLSTQSFPIIGQFAGAFSGIPFIGGFGGAGGVIGVEADVDGTDYRAQQLIPPVAAAAANGAFYNSVREQITGSVRGRIGIAVDRALFYATGGVAFGQFRENYGFLTVNGVNNITTSATNTRIGYTVGGGMEYALTTAFSLRLEYRYTDYGRFININNPTVGNNFVTQHHEYQNRVQVGFSYKFDNPVAAAPVVARY